MSEAHSIEDGFGPRADPSGAGWRALAEGKWSIARRLFGGALQLEESARTLEGASWAAWWLDDVRGVFDARERAFCLYAREGDSAGAARMATWLAADELDFRGAAAVSAGWLGRAARLLRALEPGPEHGWFAFHDGYIRSARGDPAAFARALEAAEIGRRFDVADLEMLGLALEGSLRVEAADVETGMACLDEAAALALVAEATIPISRAWTWCFLVSACEAVRDYTRAFAWCDRIAEFADRHDSGYMLGFCRLHYGLIDLHRGRWAEAENALVGAVEAFTRSRPPFVAGALSALAELRRRQGRLDEAEELVERAGGGPVLCRAKLLLDRGDAEGAVEIVEKVLRRVSGDRPTRRCSVLELLAQIAARQGDLTRTRSALAELRSIADRIGTEPIRAAAELAEGRLAAATEDHHQARLAFENSVERLDGSGAPFDAAEARMALVHSLVSLDRRSEAGRVLQSCIRTFSDLGAAGRAREATDIFRGLPASGDPVRPLPELTPREREVLRWVAEGLTNRQIAQQLVISEHTVHRHVTNSLRKLNLPSRAAAAALAVRSGLVGCSSR